MQPLIFRIHKVGHNPTMFVSLIFYNDHAQKMYMLSILNPSRKKYAFEKKVMKIIRYSQIFACQLAQKENLQLIKNILPWQQYMFQRQ